MLVSVWTVTPVSASHGSRVDPKGGQGEKKTESFNCEKGKGYRSNNRTKNRGSPWCIIKTLTIHEAKNGTANFEERGKETRRTRERATSLPTLTSAFFHIPVLL